MLQSIVAETWSVRPNRIDQQVSDLEHRNIGATVDSLQCRRHTDGDPIAITEHAVFGLAHNCRVQFCTTHFLPMTDTFNRE
jgi:hypothetical protein